MIGIIVAGLGIAYFARKLIVIQVAVPVTPVDAAGRPPDAAMGVARDLEPPGIDEIPEMLEPQLEDTLNALTDAAATRAASITDEVIDSPDLLGEGSGLGDSRPVGPGSRDGPPEPERELKYEFEGITDYAEWLDFFKIELGVLGRDNKIYYAYNLSQDQPDVRNGDPKAEKRYYMHATSGPGFAWNRQLVTRAGVAQRGDIILQFYPPEVEARLYALEEEKAGNRPRSDIRRTLFVVSRTTDGFDFQVDRQTYDF
jgi:hypothetical protein